MAREQEKLGYTESFNSMSLMPDFKDSFASRLYRVRQGRVEAMNQLVRLTTEEAALERILEGEGR